MEYSGLMQQLQEAQSALARSDLFTQKLTLRDATESINLFAFGYLRSCVANYKRNYFKDHPISKFVVIESFNNFDHLSEQIYNRHYHRIPYERFRSMLDQEASELDELESACIILTNNTVNRIGLEAFARICEKTPKAIYVLLDIDSHHWHELSLQIVGLVDVYVPGHPGSYLIEGRINSHLITGIPIGTTQWSRAFLLEHIPRLTTIERTDSPFGMHSFYAKFAYRNKIVATLAQTSDKTGLQETKATTGFVNRDELSRWLDWTCYKLHWVVPVAHDIPNRFFDALISGGIPLIPQSLKSHVVALGVPCEYFLCYEPTDVLMPDKVLQQGLKRYDEMGGGSGAVTRAMFALKRFHADETVHRMVEQSLLLYS